MPKRSILLSLVVGLFLTSSDLFAQTCGPLGGTSIDPDDISTAGLCPAGYNACILKSNDAGRGFIERKDTNEVPFQIDNTHSINDILSISPSWMSSEYPTNNAYQLVVKGDSAQCISVGGLPLVCNIRAADNKNQVLFDAQNTIASSVEKSYYVWSCRTTSCGCTPAGDCNIIDGGPVTPESPSTCYAYRVNKCTLSDNYIVPGYRTFTAWKKVSNACSQQAIYCDDGAIKDTNGGGAIINISSTPLYETQTSCQNSVPVNGTGVCGSVITQYPAGLYAAQLSSGMTNSGFLCQVGTVNPAIAIASPTTTWGCSGAIASISCSVGFKNNQPIACGILPSQSLSSLNTGTQGVCIPGTGHNDSSVIPNIQVIALGGGGSQPRNWTCGGTYHTTTTCAAESQGLCGPAGSGSNQSFSSLTQSSSGLCTNGAVGGFLAQPLNLSTLYTAKYTWNCMGSLSGASQPCLAYQAPSPTPGLCNAGINGQSLTYSQVQNSLLCTQGIPSVTLLPPIPNSGSQWTWQCLGLGQAANATCSVNAITNGQCVSYPSVQSTSPTNLCISGVPTAVTISSGSYIWLCNGSNGGISSNLCSASCVNGQCAAVTTTTGSTNPPTTGTTTTTTTTGSNGQTSPVSLNQMCTDPDGCVCYNLTIVNGSRCLANNLTGTTDSILTPVDIGEYCLDADGCTCNRTNTIVNGSVCQTDGLTGMLPGFSDLIISQAVTSGTIARRSTIEITISYHNRGPDNATGSVVEYYLSPLVSKFRTSAPYTLVQVNSSGYVQSSEYQNNVLVFPVGDLKSNEGGQITIQLTLQASLNDTEVINATSIGSRVRDPKPLDNVQKIYLSLDTQQATTLGVYMVNPFLGIQSMIQQYDTMNTWLRIDPVFDDIQRGDDDFMSVMTVVRNGIFEGYRYKFSRSFGADKCATRIEAINVIAKMMYTVGSTDVYTTRQKGTAYVDTNGISSQSQNFINRAHERGLLKVLSPKSIRGSLYLEPHKDITQAQVKTIIYLIYQRYGLDPSIIESLLTDENSCTTRGELAYVMTQIMRGNPNIMMGYNDEFLKQLVSRTSKLTIAQRRIEIKKIIDKLKVTEPSVLSANGYDGESLVGILEAAMAGRVYNPIVDLTTTKNFLYEKRE